MLVFQLENEQNKLEVADELLKLMEKSAQAVFDFEGFEDFEAEVSVTLVDNDIIRGINKEHRHKDSETDVLSFPQYESLKDEESLEEEQLYLGDIVISVEKAVEQSKDYGHSFEREMCFLTVHSMLHLLGYDHMTPEEEKEMNTLQETILEQLGILRS